MVSSNKATLLKRPGESKYNHVRRLLIVNQGLKDFSLDIEGPERHFYIFRQCPECSKELFHSSLFEVPWLKHCPIHHCPLLERCPDCQRPWLGLALKIARKCKTCGTVLLAEDQVNLIADYSEISSPLNEIIEIIGEYLTSRNRELSYTLLDRLGRRAPRISPWDTILYPSFVMKLNNNNYSMGNPP